MTFAQPWGKICVEKSLGKTWLQSFLPLSILPFPSLLYAADLQRLGASDTLAYHATPVVEILRSFEQCSGDGFCAHIVSQDVRERIMPSTGTSQSVVGRM
jgi:hypothetical protein